MNTYSSNKFLKKINKPLFLCLLDILNKNNIKYFGSSGTLLGAIRHQGIIPWDTDIDIGMFYQDLQQLFDCLEGTSFFIWGIPDYTFFTNKEYDSLYEQTLIVKDKEQLNKIYRRMEEIISEYSPIVPLYYDMSVRLKQKNIIGLDNNALNILDLKTVYKKN